MSALPREESRRGYAPVREDRRHLDAVATRARTAARPRAVYAFVTISGLFVILIVQLLLSIIVSDGAYQISALQKEHKELSLDAQSLSEQLQVLDSPQHLASNARALGMVTNLSTAYLQLSDGTVRGTPTAARGVGSADHAANRPLLTPNQLLNGVELTPVSTVDPADDSSLVAGGTFTGAPEDRGDAATVRSENAPLPTPVTR